MKKSIITIAGALGSGKSSTAKRVAAELGYRHFSSGDLFRRIAKEKGLSVEALNLTAEDQQDIDRRVDELLQKMNEDENELVLDSRLAFHWMPDSFKVFLTLDPDTASERIFTHMQDEGRVSEDATSPDEVKASIERRAASEEKRYYNLYQISPTAPSNFDLIVDTKHNNLDAVVKIVLDAYNEWRRA